MSSILRFNFIKKISLCFLGLVMVTFVYSPAQVKAYDPRDYDRLMRTGNCVDCDLSFVVLKKVDLSGSDLRGSNLTNAQLQGANLFKADLFGTILLGANLSYAHWVDGSTCKDNSIGYCR